MKCYLCDIEATSKEHCPALSFFPKDKRINLMTVPSCYKHNGETSLDDEYVRNLILITKGNNKTAAQHFKDKGARSLQRSLGLFHLQTKNPKWLNFIKNDENSKNLAFEIDRNRFDKVMRKIAYGVYYYIFKTTWNRNLEVATNHLVTYDIQVDPISEEIQRYKNEYVSKIVYEGSNPSVFQYSYLIEKENKNIILIMKFYESFEIWIVPEKNSEEPCLH